jgi:arylsulfatase A-like enzyme
MTVKKSFIIILRIVFVLFSLQFLKDAFYKWDGYSFHMRFIEFLPDLSLSFILWTIPWVIFVFVLWLIAYGLFKIIPKSLIAVRIEHMMFFYIFIVLPLFIKRTFYNHISVSDLIGLSHLTTLIIGGILVALAVWFGYRYVEKILYGIDNRITPLVWLFGLLLVLALPLSIYKPESSEAKYMPDKGAPVTSQGGVVRTLDKKRPNIILLIMDSLTTKDMQVYGYERPTTPFISEWVKDAVVFNRAYSSCNWTTPSVMSLLTGQRVWTHRVWYDAYYNPVDNYETNLPRLLSYNGYAVYGFVQNMTAHPEVLGIEDAFTIKDKTHTFWILKNGWFDKLINFFVINRPIANAWVKTDVITNKLIIMNKLNAYRPVKYTTAPSDMVYNRFLDSIQQSKKSQSPFFAYLHLFPPHFPYLPPRPYVGLFGDAEKFNSEQKQENNFYFDAEYDLERQGDVDILRKRYDEFILYSDQQFKLFISRLAETIDMSNTIIIFSSDHGESFSHGWLAHAGPHLYEPLVHIPLIIKMPGKTNGKVIDMPVEQIDIAPTILDLVDIPIPEWIEGRSLVPLIEGKSLKSRPVFSMQFRRNRSLGHPITKGTVAVWEGDYKLIYYLKDKKSLLFNLKSDPDETHNIFNEKPEIAQRFIKLIEDNLSRVNKRIAQSVEG